jgi:hypothetical protein
MNGMRGLDAWLTREPWDPITEPHAPWVPIWVSVEGDHWNAPMEGKRGWWAVEHGGDTDGETTMHVGTREQADEACRRMNARYEYVRERDRDPVSGICRVCGDLHEYPESEMSRSELAEFEFPDEGPTGIAGWLSGRYS